MLVLEPHITVNWDSEGVDLHVHTYLYMEATTAPALRGIPVNGEGAIALWVRVYREGITKAVTDTSPEVMAAVDAWIGAQDFMALREKEEAIYKQVMEGVHIPDRLPSGGREYVEYPLTVQPVGKPPLYVTLRVGKGGASVAIQLAGSEYDGDAEVICTMDTYPLDPPITMHKIKASVRSTFQAYTDCL